MTFKKLCLSGLLLGGWYSFPYRTLFSPKDIRP